MKKKKPSNAKIPKKKFPKLSMSDYVKDNGWASGLDDTHKSEIIKYCAKNSYTKTKMILNKNEQKIFKKLMDSNYNDALILEDALKKSSKFYSLFVEYYPNNNKNEIAESVIADKIMDLGTNNKYFIDLMIFHSDIGDRLIVQFGSENAKKALIETEYKDIEKWLKLKFV